MTHEDMMQGYKKRVNQLREIIIIEEEKLHGNNNDYVKQLALKRILEAENELGGLRRFE